MKISDGCALACRESFGIAGNYQAYRDLLKEATPHLGYLGSRYITVKGYDGYLHLDKIPADIVFNKFTRKSRCWFFIPKKDYKKLSVDDLLNIRDRHMDPCVCKEYLEVPKNQQKMFKEVGDLITDMYVQYDLILKTSNLFSRFLGLLREMFTLKYVGFHGIYPEKFFSRQRWMKNVKSGWSEKEVEDIRDHREFRRVWWRSMDFPGFEWTICMGLREPD